MLVGARRSRRTLETTESCAGKQRLDGGQRKRKANGGDDWRDPGTIPSAWRMLTARRSGRRSRLASGTLQSAAIRRRRRRVRGDSTGKRGWLSIRKTGEGDGERGEAGERRRGGLVILQSHGFVRHRGGATWRHGRRPLWRQWGRRGFHENPPGTIFYICKKVQQRL